MTGHDYEYLVAKYLRNNGYTGVKVTKGSGDYGVDVVAHKRGKKYAVQCKYYTGPVGLSAVQEAVAGKAMYKCDSAMVVTNSTFTNAARDLARANNVVLIENVSKAGGGCTRVIFKALLVYGCVMAAVAIVCSTIENAQGLPIGTAIKNIFFAVVGVSCLLWIKPAAKGLKKMIKQVLSKIKKLPTVSESHAQGVQAISVPKEPVAPVRPPQERQIEPVPFANANTVSLYLYDDPYSDSIVKTLCLLPTFSISLIQRRCKLGYARASRIIDDLESAGLIAHDPNHATSYLWTDKAREPITSKPKAEPQITVPAIEYPEEFKQYLKRRPIAVEQEDNDQHDADNYSGLRSLKEEQPDLYAAVYDAIKLGLKHGNISVSLLQRYLKWGYGQSARLIDKLEELGFVSPFNGSKPRQVLVSEQDVINLIAAVESET